jgi:TldD protein
MKLERILDAALEKGGDFADVFVEKKFTTGIGCEDNRIERVDSGIDLGAGVRVVNGDTTSYAYTNDISLQGLIQVADIASRAAAGSRQVTNVKITKRVPEFDFNVELPPDMVPVSDKVDQVERANRAARRVDERINRFP